MECFIDDCIESKEMIELLLYIIVAFFLARTGALLMMEITEQGDNYF
jgi:hypothetical protein